MSELQEVVAMVEEINENEERRCRVFEASERKEDVECQVCKRKACCFSPLVLVFIGLCVYFTFSIVRTAMFTDTLTVSYLYDQPHAYWGSNLTSGLCKALSIRSLEDKKVLADFFLFPSNWDFSYSTVYTCRNTSYCRIPHSAAAEFVLIRFNTTDPEKLNSYLRDLKCIVTKHYGYLLWGGLLVANIILFIVACVLTRRKIFPRFLRKELRSVKRELLRLGCDE